MPLQGQQPSSHCDAVAGVNSIIKMVLAMQHKQLPPDALFDVPSQKLDLIDSPLYVSDELRDWNEDVRRCGIGGFGINGTNVHIVMEDYKKSETSSDRDEVNIITLSAKTPAALRNYAEEYIRFLGARANSIAFNFARSGEAQATVSLMAQSETAANTSISVAPVVKNYTRFSQFQGFIKSGGQTLANVTSASVTYSNNLEKIETIRSDGKVEAIDLGVASLSGSIAVRYGDNTLMDKARAGIPVDLELGYQLSESQKLVITCHEVYLPKPKRSISGPGGIECSYDFQGAKNASLGKMVTVQLINDVEEY